MVRGYRVSRGGKVLVMFTLLLTLGVTTVDAQPPWSWKVTHEYSSNGELILEALEGEVAHWMSCSNSWFETLNMTTPQPSSGNRIEEYMANYQDVTLGYTVTEAESRTEVWLACDGAVLAAMPEESESNSNNCYTPSFDNGPPGGGTCAYECEPTPPPANPNHLRLEWSGFFVLGVTQCANTGASCHWGTEEPLHCVEWSDLEVLWEGAGSCSVTGAIVLRGHCASFPLQ